MNLKLEYTDSRMPGEIDCDNLRVSKFPSLQKLRNVTQVAIFVKAWFLRSK